MYPVLVRELLPKIGFAWTTRVLGFLNLGLLAIAFTFMRPRLPPRSTGPVVDWKAFSEPVFVLFVAGIFFVLWNVYFTFYYVRLSDCRDLQGTTNADGCCLDCILWHRRSRLAVHGIHNSSNDHQRCWVSTTSSSEASDRATTKLTSISPDSPSASSHPSSPTNSAPSTPSAPSSSA